MTSRRFQGVAFAMGLILALQVPAAAQAAQAVPSVESIEALPDAPSASAQSQNSSSSEPRLTSAAQVPANQNPTNQQTPAHETPTEKPQGAAAAAIQPTTGSPASQPAGAALAPAKQKRSRSLLIKLGALAGAGIAVGTAFALSSASPSRPPGAR